MLRIALNLLPYTEEDEQKSIDLCISGRPKDFEQLLQHNQKLIAHIAEMFYRGVRIDIPYEEIEHIARMGFLLGAKGYNYKKPFMEFVVFYTEQYVFYQIYTEYFLLQVQPEKRIFIQKLYSRFLKNLNKETGTNYYNALTLAAEEIEMPLDLAVSLLSEFMTLSLREVRESEFTDEIDKMTSWLRGNNNKPTNLTEAPLSCMLVLMEAQMQAKEKKKCHLPFQAICNKFVATV